MTDDLRDVLIRRHPSWPESYFTPEVVSVVKKYAVPEVVAVIHGWELCHPRAHGVGDVYGCTAGAIDREKLQVFLKSFKPEVLADLRKGLQCDDTLDLVREFTKVLSNPVLIDDIEAWCNLRLVDPYKAPGA